jgi:hypothetical protein
MTLFGRQVSIAVLVSFVVTLATTVGGTWIAIVNNWGTTDPAALAVAVAGAVGVTITAAVHVWDTQAGQPPAVPPKVP